MRLGQLLAPRSVTIRHSKMSISRVSCVIAEEVVSVYGHRVTV